jgi:D-tyrosyl-tRNA(Tyr) deacylase
MRVVIQRVKKANVKVKGKIVGKIGQGLVILLGVGKDDTEENAQELAEKIINLRIFETKKSYFDRSLLDVGGKVLVVPQFTLFADTSKGRRPFFGGAAKPPIAKPLFEKFVEILKEKSIKVEKGQFGAKMEVELINDGPVTIILDTKSENKI